MCYNVSFLINKAGKLAERYQGVMPPKWKEQLADTTADDGLPTYYFVSGFSHPVLPLVTTDGLELAVWGLIPHWTRDWEVAGKLRTGTLNARGETVFEKASFQKSIRTKRCILPVNGFFEWRDHGNVKYPYYIYPKNNDLFSLACIYDHWSDKETGQIITSFSILTTEANDMMAVIHNRKKRIPFILPPGKEQSWTNKDTPHKHIREMIMPCMDDHMQAHPVSRNLNNPRNDRNVPDALEIVEYPELPAIA